MMSQFKDEMGGKLAELESRMDGQDGQLGELIKVTDNPLTQNLQGPGMGQLSDNVRQAVYTGRCLPYNAVVDIFVPKGLAGEALTGSIFVTQDGPVFISRIFAFAQIDRDDAAAKNFPVSLIDPPLCTDACDPDSIALNQSAKFTVKESSLFPKRSVAGCYIPIGARNCRLICCGTEVLCGTLECEGEADRNFNTRVPLLDLDHPECFDGLIDIFTNDCGWQSVSYPMGMLEDGMFDITNESPDCIGVCGFVDCNKVLKTIITPQKPHRFDINLQIVFAGFRVLTCGGPACSTG